MKRRCPNIAKIRKFINYQPKVSLDGILDRIISHMREEL